MWPISLQQISIVNATDPVIDLSCRSLLVYKQSSDTLTLGLSRHSCIQ